MLNFCLQITTMKKFTTLLFISLLCWQSETKAQACHESGPEPHAMAPIGIMGGHVHSKGHLMASYRYMMMNMKGMSSSGTNLSSEEVLTSSMMAPTSMTMQMHMLGLMYSPHDRITLMAMSSYRTNTMGMDSEANHELGMSDDHSDLGMNQPMELTQSYMKNQGLGDTKFSALIRLNKNEKHCLHSITGLRFPTGNIDAGNKMHPILPYGMQNGTGSIGAILGVNYSWLMPKFLVGAQALSASPLHKNNRGYMSSVTHDVSFWVARKWADWMSSSLRLHTHYQSEIRGSDALINPMMSPASNGANESLYFTNAILGVNLKPINHWRIAIEAGLPIYQMNKGVHLNEGVTLTAGFQFMLH